MNLDDAILVCSHVSYFTDDVRGQCSDCGAAIVWRPHAPAVSRRICMRCFAQAELIDPQVLVTPQTVMELADWIAGRQDAHRRN